jgi:hypothetical protein
VIRTKALIRFIKYGLMKDSLSRNRINSN